MVVVSHVVVVEVNEALNRLFNRGHLQERHFVIPKENTRKREICQSPGRSPNAKVFRP